MDFGMLGRVAFISGASRGIGAATAIAYAAEGARVVIGYHSDAAAAARVAELVAEAGGEAASVALDLFDDASIDSAAEQAIDRWGQVDVVVSNAGTMPTPGPFASQLDGQWQAALRGQLEGPGRLIQRLVPSMQDRGWGRIVSVSSVHAANGAAGVVAHTAAKSGLHGLTRSLAKELGPHGVLVNLVMPGLTMTERARERFGAEHIERATALIPTGHVSEPDDIARLILFLGSAANGNINGELVRSAGGL